MRLKTLKNSNNDYSLYLHKFQNLKADYDESLRPHVTLPTDEFMNVSFTICENIIENKFDIMLKDIKESPTGVNSIQLDL